MSSFVVNLEHRRDATFFLCGGEPFHLSSLLPVLHLQQYLFGKHLVSVAVFPFEPGNFRALATVPYPLNLTSKVQPASGWHIATSWLNLQPHQGLAAFDPFSMFKRLTEVALRHVDLLSRTFQLCSWVTGANEAACHDQYLEIFDFLKTHTADFEITRVSKNLINFLLELEFLQTKSSLISIPAVPIVPLPLSQWEQLT